MGLVYADIELYNTDDIDSLTMAIENRKKYTRPL